MTGAAAAAAARHGTAYGRCLVVVRVVQGGRGVAVGSRKRLDGEEGGSRPYRKGRTARTCLPFFSVGLRRVLGATT